MAFLALAPIMKGFPMTRSARILALASSLVLVGVMSGTAAAVPPTRNCPAGGPFTLYSTAQLLALAIELSGPEGAQEAVDFVLDAFDHNADGNLCVQDLTDAGDRERAYNFVDNAAR